MTIDELVLLVEKKLPPATEKQIAIFEGKIGASLPDDYRGFLAACNGGYLGGRFWLRNAMSGGRHAEVGLDHIGGFREEGHFSLEVPRDCYQSDDELRIPRDLIWIMDDPFGNAICLGVKGQSRGKVYFWDHEEEPDPDEWDGSMETAGNVTCIASSFTELAAGLAPLDA